MRAQAVPGMQAHSFFSVPARLSCFGLLPVLFPAESCYTLLGNSPQEGTFMCTVIVYRTGSGTYFGRNMDLDVPFGEKVIRTPAGYPFRLKSGEEFHTRHSFIGMASAAGNYPLYAEAANDKGLAMAGLNFPGTAVYHPQKEGMHNITPYELIPWILGQAETVDEAEGLLRQTSLLSIPFSSNMPLAPLHFIVSDRKRSLVAEPRQDGLRLYKDPYDVLTNNPPFDYHDWNMRNYRRLSASNSENSFTADYDLPPYAQGMGSIGLPGDPSSASRFVRAAFSLSHSPKDRGDAYSVCQAFHILDSVAMCEGTVRCEGGTLDITRYSVCVRLEDNAFYYRTYGNSRITKIRPVEPHAGSLSVHLLHTEQDMREE